MENKFEKNVDPSGVQLYKKPVGEVEIYLPCGLFHDGEVYREAKISPLTARDRKDLAEARNNPAKAITKLLTNRLTVVGPFSRPIPDYVINKLLSGDRDFIIYQLHRITDPNKTELEATLQCSARGCGAQFEFVIPFSEIKIKEMSDTISIYDEKKTRYWEFESVEWEVKAKFRFVDGKIQEAIAPRLRSNPVEGEYLLFSKMLLEWNGLTSLTMDQIESLPEPLIREIEKSLTEKAKYGPDFDVKIMCPECGTVMRGGIDFSTFLFR